MSIEYRRLLASGSYTALFCTYFLRVTFESATFDGIYTDQWTENCCWARSLLDAPDFLHGSDDVVDEPRPDSTVMKVTLCIWNITLANPRGSERNMHSANGLSESLSFN